MHHLLHYSNGTLCVYTPTSESRRWWRRTVAGCDAEEKGKPYLVQNSINGMVAIISVAGDPKPKDMLVSFLDGLRE